MNSPHNFKTGIPVDSWDGPVTVFNTNNNNNNMNSPTLMFNNINTRIRVWCRFIVSTW